MNLKYDIKQWLLVLMLLSTAILRAKDIETIKVKDNVYMVGDRTYSLFYITDSGVIVIDPISEKHASATLKAIKGLTSLPVTHVFYSHNHWDHIRGAQVFKAQGATIISHAEAKAQIATNTEVVLPDETWAGTSTHYSIGNKTLELFYFGKNHGNGMTVFRFPEHNMVFTVDLVVPDRVLYAYLPDAKPKAWVESLAQIDALAFDTLLMSHVRAVGSRDDLHIMQGYFKALYAAVQAELDKGTNLFDIPYSVKLPQYKHLMNYEVWLPMNVWRILMEKSIGQ
ncbi:MBL fold metallo-hydrolase [Formosa sp. S-31]|uniref:MBL fold metallo-hydrolase n=1 Tax=Formosa sp. S-31 TaxID=2790949 RepID=UPI003EC0ABF8